MNDWTPTPGKLFYFIFIGYDGVMGVSSKTCIDHSELKPFIDSGNCYQNVLGAEKAMRTIKEYLLGVKGWIKGKVDGITEKPAEEPQQATAPVMEQTAPVAEPKPAPATPKKEVVKGSARAHYKTTKGRGMPGEMRDEEEDFVLTKRS